MKGKGAAEEIKPHRRKHKANEKGYCNATVVRKQQKRLIFPSPNNM
jgi:hypothetical protein